MAADKRVKSSRYPGVYWRQDKSGEKMYYIHYRVGGRDGKQVEEPVGKSSGGMTEARAAQARSARISGKDVSNKTHHENVQAQKAEEFLLGEAWNAYSEINSERPLYETDKCLLKYFPHLMTKCPPHPGELLQELFMKPLDLSVTKLAAKLEIVPATLEAFIAQRSSVTVDLAMRLSRAFGNTPEFWLNAQRNVDVWQACQGQQAWRVVQPICVSTAHIESL